MQKLKNYDITSFTSKDMLSKRVAAADKTGKGNAFQTTSCFKDLKQMYKRNNPVQASLDKSRKIVISSLDRKKKTSQPLQKIESVVTMNEDTKDLKSPRMKRKLISMKLSIEENLQVES